MRQRETGRHTYRQTERNKQQYHAALTPKQNNLSKKKAETQKRKPKVARDTQTSNYRSYQQGDSRLVDGPVLYLFTK